MTARLNQIGAIALMIGAVSLLWAPSPAVGKLRIGGWLPYWTQPANAGTVRENRDLFSSASPFWFEAKGATNISENPGAGSQQVLRKLRRAKVDVIPTVSSSMSPEKAVAVLGSKRRRALHVRAVARLARPYDGVDFNYEYPALTTDPDTAIEVRNAFNRFFKSACARLQRDGKLCVVTVMPRKSPKVEVWRGKLIPWVYDYELIGEVADRMRVMAYDQHAPGTAPGPIAGAPWVERVARFSARQAAPRKVELGVPLYGRVWQRTGRSSPPTRQSAGAAGRTASILHTEPMPFGGGSQPQPRAATVVATLTHDEGESYRRRLGARARWSARQLSPWFEKGSYEGWFSNARSVIARARIADAHGLRGLYFWSIGGEDPKTWAKLRRYR